MKRTADEVGRTKRIIRDYCDYHNINAGELAKRAGVSFQTVYRFTSKHNVDMDMTVAAFVKLASYTGISLDMMLMGDKHARR